MKIGIVGWYGTETLGDRAILDGILKVLSKLEYKTTVYLGSLFPFFSQRTLYEDSLVYKDTAPSTNIELFDLRDRKSVRYCIDNIDLLLIGGGPLMDNIEEVFLLEACFEYAIKRHIPTVVFGCGIGPLNMPIYRNSVKRILDMATAVYLRDNLSAQYSEKYLDYSKFFVVGDPAVISIENFRNSHSRQDYLAVNLRDYPKSAYSAKTIVSDDDFSGMIEECAKMFGKVLLVPMHTFSVGGDDRKYLIKLKNTINKDNIEVLQKPLNLWELYDVYANAAACVGMRYHSVIMQTILNGNNIVLDYTNSRYGKIVGFINQLKNNFFYESRTIHLQDITSWNCKEKLGILKQGERYYYTKSNMLDHYVELLNKL